MKANDKIQRPSNSAVSMASRDATNMPHKVDPAEIIRKIDTLEKESRKYTEPSFWEQLFSVKKRHQAAMLAELKTSAITGRKELIDGFNSAIKIYVDAHKGDLKVRSGGFVIATLQEITEALFRISESTIASFMETYSTMVDRYNAIPNLSEAQRTEIIGKAFLRAMDSQDNGQKVYEQTLASLRHKVEDVIAEIGS